MTREEAFTKLAVLGAATAVVRYSGGGDEGGVDEIDILDGGADLLHVLLDHHDGGLDPGEATELAEALEAPVDEQHGGFIGAGVEGTLTWVVSARKVIDRPSHEEYVEYGPFEV